MDLSTELKPLAISAWQLAKERLYDSRTNLFYDFVSDYDPEHRFDHLPTLEEIADQYPNPNGWVTGMEDSVISGGAMLACLCDRYAATGEASLRAEAAGLFEGLKLCGTISKEPGFVVRSVSPLDGKSTYTESSRDQLTHFAHGLWRFYHSSLSDDDQRGDIRSMLTALSERLVRRMTAEHDYRYGREDGSPGLPDRMWGSIGAHEVSRLPMIYGVTWQITGETRWREQYRAYAEEAAERSADLRLDNVPERPCYGLFQHQYALEALAGIETEDDDLAEEYRRQMIRIAGVMPAYAEKIKTYRPVDVREVEVDFRNLPSREKVIPRFQATGARHCHVAQWDPRMRYDEFVPLRELGESLLICLAAPNLELSEEQLDCLRQGLAEVDYSLACSKGMLYPQAAYWRWAAQQPHTLFA